MEDNTSNYEIIEQENERILIFEGKEYRTYYSK